MKQLTPYLFFDGRCREGMEFYRSCFGGELTLMRYADSPEEAGEGGAHTDPDRVMHACLTNGEVSLMASDTPVDGPKIGDHVALSVQCETIADIQRLFTALSEGGKVTMPLADTFWGSHFGMLVDKFGFHWMLDLPLKEQDK